MARRWVSLIAGFVWLAACATAPQGSAQSASVAAEQPYAPLILIGLDGLRWDIIDRHPAPNLQTLAQEGVRAQGLIPVTPSKTFPNFYAIASGLYPEHSGVLGNETYDRDLDVLWRTRNASDPRWWRGEPIWVTAEKQGLKTATLFWVGSEAVIGGVQPSYWYAYDEAMTHDARVAQVMAWLDLPAAERPTLIALYFDAIDSASHEYGFNSQAERDAVASVDAAVGAIIAGLGARGLRSAANIVVVGDHGMTEISPDRVVYLDDYFDIDSITSPELADGWGEAVSVSFMGEPEEIEAAYAAFAFAHPAMTAYRRGQLPADWHIDDPTRGPDLFLMPEPGWILSRRSVPLSDDYRATHGYDHDARAMHASFIADGPAFRSGAVVEPFENVNLYSLFAHILELEPAPTDGSLAAVADVLAAPP